MTSRVTGSMEPTLVPSIADAAQSVSVMVKDLNSAWAQDSKEMQSAVMGVSVKHLLLTLGRAQFKRVIAEDSTEGVTSGHWEVEEALRCDEGTCLTDLAGTLT